MKTNFIWSNLVMVVVMVLSMIMTSCRSDDDNFHLPKCYVNKNDLSFNSKKGDVRELSITCNGKWKISNVPDWLIAESMEGRGTTTVKFTTSMSNTTSSPYEGLMKVTFEEDPDAIETIRVEQRGDAVANCGVTPNLIETLSDGIACDFNLDNNVVKYYRGFLPKSDVGRMSEEDIIEKLKNEFRPHIPSDEELASADGLKPGTCYVIYTLGFDKKGNRGELIATEVSTMNIKNNEPIAKVEDIRKNGMYWNWSTRKETASCNGYFMMTTENYDVANVPDVCQAWMMKYAIQNGAISEYVNDAGWKQKVNNGSFFFVWTRGVDCHGNMSGTIDWGYITGTNTRAASVIEPSWAKQKGNVCRDHSSRKPSPDQYKLYKVM